MMAVGLSTACDAVDRAVVSSKSAWTAAGRVVDGRVLPQGTEWLSDTGPRFPLAGPRCQIRYRIVEFQKHHAHLLDAEGKRPNDGLRSILLPEPDCSSARPDQAIDVVYEVRGEGIEVNSISARK